MSIFNHVCADCIGEPHLSAFVRRIAQSDDECAYCEKIKPVTKLENIVERVALAIDSFYELTSDTEAVVIYERSPDGEPMNDVINEMLNSVGASADGLADDVCEALADSWFDYSSHEKKYGEDPYFIRVSPSPGQVAKSWARMLDKLRHEARYINPEVTRILEDVFGQLEEDRTSVGTSVVTRVGPSHSISSLYRARTFHTKEQVAKAIAHPERELGPPPREKAAAGRMNARGVPVFYGATEPDVAVSEVRPPVGSQVLVGRFFIHRELRLLDLSKFESVVPTADMSMFDEQATRKFQRISFLKHLGNELTQPVMPDETEQGYLLTQVVSDYLATHPKLNLDGILFRSIQLPGNNANEHLNAILFVKAASVALSGPEHGKEMGGFWYHDYVYRFGEEGPLDGPGPKVEINSNVYPLDNKSDTRKDPLFTLELDRDSLEIHEVVRAKYFTKSTSVESEQTKAVDLKGRSEPILTRRPHKTLGPVPPLSPS